ncbi:DHA2 family efflux MFS transporter permease subunit [Actinomadura sp. DC4]|uniref:DHA2 family efflux MFS transporter permease subunit n=1 Tax=Actinomadura sp. DC4 TaxID=3055069 RepID=UPI0025B275AE|nr:DHA2 family efflux MFS transporter permease subunit [Actinomadura sp. DC4]MDN3352664.1 DHA2 family efflux MFS transporter permease subunit [Actinomadura sp. DC4]
MRKWHGNQWAILLTLSLGFFMTLLDLTIVNIAMPSMIDQLHASLDEILWVINAYVLILAVLLITAGRLGDVRGQRNIFIFGVAAFTVASLLCGISQNAAELIAARCVQGLGAAMLMPQTMAIIVATFPPQRRGTALGIWGAVAGVATIAGPTLGGFLVSTFDWRWIFFVNLPIGVIVLVAAVTVIPSVKQERQHRLDLGGVLIATAALFCLSFALTEGQRYEWNAWIWALGAASIVLLVIFLFQQRTQQGNEPLVPFSLFRDRNYTILNFIAAAVSVGMIGMFLPLTIYLQSVLGYSALKAGLVMAPMSVISMFVAPVAGRLSDRIGGKFILMGGLTLYAIGMAWIVLIAEPTTDWPAFWPALIVAGVGVGCVFAPMATEAMRGIEPRMAGAASGVYNTIRQIGSVVGSAAMGAILQNQLASSLRHEATVRSGALPAQARAPFIAGFKNAGKSGIEVGAGQSGAPRNVPGNLPESAAAQIAKAGKAVFDHGFVTAMKPTMALPIVVVVVAALSCLVMKKYVRAGEPRPAETVEATAG